MWIDWYFVVVVSFNRNSLHSFHSMGIWTFSHADNVVIQSSELAESLNEPIFGSV